MTIPISAPEVDYDVPDLDEQDVASRAKRAMEVLQNDRDSELCRIENYLHGDQPGPYMPDTATEEYRLLAKRSTSNFMTLVLNAPAQALFVEGHRLAGSGDPSPAWKCWQRNRLDGRQSSVYRSALSYGQSFVAVDRGHDGKAVALLLSPLFTTALYEDPVNDARPALVLNIRKYPNMSGEHPTPGSARMWDRERYYELTFESGFANIQVTGFRDHGFSDTPVVSFTPYRDLEGRPYGILTQLFRIQDRLNQTIFDLLAQQMESSFNVRYATGVVPPDKVVWFDITVQEAVESGKISADDPRIAGKAPTDVIGRRSEKVLDPDGKPVPQEITVKPGSLLTIKDPSARMGSLPGTPLTGYIESISMSVHHIAAISQVPPHYLLGDMANLSADALAVAESSLWRMVAEFQHSFGESWEMVFQLFAEAENLDGQDEFDSEVMWRDMSARSLGQTVDALGKASQMLGIPGRALWSWIPGATAGEVTSWEQIAEDQANNLQLQDPQANMANAVSGPNKHLISSYNYQTE